MLPPMRTPAGFNALVDEPFPERREIAEEKVALRKSVAVLHSDVRSIQEWIEIMRDRARDQWDPED